MSKQRHRHATWQGLITALGCFTLGLSAPAVLAQQQGNAAATDEKELGRMEVRGRAMSDDLSVDLAEYGNSVQIITADDIARGGYTNAAEAIQQEVRGAHIRYSPDEGEFKVHLDGGGNRDTLVLQDGVPLYDRGPALETIWGTTIINPHMIERIEVYRGGQSLYYGSNAGIGVINIVTKEPDGTEKGEFGVRYGSFNTREAFGNVSGAIDEAGRHSFMFYGGYKKTDTYDLFKDEAYPDNMKAAGGQHNMPLTRDNVGFKYYWNIDATSDLRFNAQYTQVDFRDAFAHSTVFAPNYTKYPLADLDYFKQWGENLSTTFEAYWRNPELRNTEMYPEICENPSGCEDPNNPGETIDQGEWMGSYENYNNKGFGRNQVMGGFEDYGFNLRNRARLGRHEAVLGVQNVNYRNDSDEEITIDDDTKTVTGVYLDYRPYLFFSPSTRLSLAGRVDFSEGFGERETWKVGLRQPIAGGVYLRGNGGTSYSLPLTNELYANSETFEGNPDLEAEESTHADIGLGIDTNFGGNAFSAELRYFMTDITDRIDTLDASERPDSDRATPINVDDTTEIRGYSAWMQLNLQRNWTLRLSGTATDATVEGSDEQLEARPEWFVKGSVDFRSDSDRYHASLLPRYMGPIYYRSGGYEVNYGEYFVLNATAQYWHGDNRQHRFMVRFVNLTDEDYSERQTGGDLRYSSAFNSGEIDQSDEAYDYQYGFRGKPRSVFVGYTYLF